MDSFAETPDGTLFTVNGFDSPLRWDGQTVQMEKVGLTAPTTALTLAKSGSGLLVGDYYAYLRFVDRFGQFSNLSPISSKLVVSGSTGTLTAATNKTPIVVTTASAHGLATGATVKITGVGGNTAANGTFTITVVTSTTFKLNSSSGNGTYTGGGDWFSGAGTITFSAVQVASDPKVVRRQILRNTDGQTDTFYVDVDSTNLSATSFTSTKDDDTLSAGTAVPLFDLNDNPLANRHAPPPNYKAYLCAHQNRMFMAGEYNYTRGSCKVTFGSPTVTGVGTGWTASLAARKLYITGATQSYDISSVDTAAQTLTLTGNYQDTTNKFCEYAIRPAPAERKLVYYSEANLFESWQATSSFQIPEDGDEISGIMSMRSFLYILEKRHIYKMSFQNDPAEDGAVFLAASRGCVNHRCFVQVDSTAYLLDENGIYRFGGSSEVEHVSTAIQDIFRPESDSPWKINWKASQYFHAVLDRPRQTIIWFVTMGGMTIPRHAISFNYRLGRWWVEEMHENIGGSVLGQLSGESPAIFMGGRNKKVYSYGQRNLDVVNADLGTVRGTVTSSSTIKLVDSTATFPSSTIVNSPISIVGGTGKGQTRRIVAVSGTTITVDQPWLELPDTTSTYQIGAIPWKWRSGWFRMSNAETDQPRRIELDFEPLENSATADMRLYYNFSGEPEVQKVTKSSEAGGGVKTTEDEADIVLDLTRDDGVLQHITPNHRELWSKGKRYSQVEITGFSTSEQQTFYQIVYEGVYGGQGEE